MSKHFIISLIKSVVRILSCIVGAVSLWKSNQLAAKAFIGLAGAEIIGIIEEIGE
jgi:predicted small integral membrane protein